MMIQVTKAGVLEGGGGRGGGKGGDPGSRGVDGLGFDARNGNAVPMPTNTSTSAAINIPPDVIMTTAATATTTNHTLMPAPNGYLNPAKQALVAVTAAAAVQKPFQFATDVRAKQRRLQTLADAISTAPLLEYSQMDPKFPVTVTMTQGPNDDLTGVTKSANCEERRRDTVAKKVKTSKIGGKGMMTKDARSVPIEGDDTVETAVASTTSPQKGSLSLLISPPSLDKEPESMKIDSGSTAPSFLPPPSLLPTLPLPTAPPISPFVPPTSTNLQRFNPSSTALNLSRQPPNAVDLARLKMLQQRRWREAEESAKRKGKELEVAMDKLSVAHYHRSLLLRFGLNPWRRLMDQTAAAEHRAHEAWRRRKLKGILCAFLDLVVRVRGRVVARQAAAIALACHHGRMRTLENVFGAWGGLATAILHGRRQLKRQVVLQWRGELRLACQRAVAAEDFDSVRRLRGCLLQWRKIAMVEAARVLAEELQRLYNTRKELGLKILRRVFREWRLLAVESNNQRDLLHNKDDMKKKIDGWLQEIRQARNFS
mmetsp:Transcript_31018/g.56393  ORF Transcript_31018/g.56393 Transcript_31018/m.56393 type:complete len:540 (-) Transcript_31018:27-1646(-)